MFRAQRQILVRYWLDWLRSRTQGSTFWEKVKVPPYTFTEKLPTDFKAKQLTDRWGYGVSDLSARGSRRSDDRVVAREGLELRQFLGRK